KSKMSAAMAARFSGKVVLITGGGGGIGRAAAERFASEGARVALVDLVPAALAQSAAAAEKAGGEVLTVHADVTRLADVERYAEAAIKRYGAIDIFFNNAGVLGADRHDDGAAARGRRQARATDRDHPDAPLRLARGSSRARRVPGERRRGVHHRRHLHRRRRCDGVIVAVTGSSGLLGSALIASLIADGHGVIRLIRRDPRPGERALRWDPTSGAITPSGPAPAGAAVH